MLSKNAEKTVTDFNQDNDFFGYNKTPKIWKHSDKEVIEIHQLLQNHLNLIIDKDSFLYPEPKTYHYPKFSTIKLLSIYDFNEKIEEELVLFKFNEDSIFEDMEHAENLLINSKSGNKFYGVILDWGDKLLFDSENTFSDKVPGKILSHKYDKKGNIKLLMKWKYLSYDESTWVLLELYRDLLIVKDYLHENLIQ
jgi:hypothetical protein